MEIQSAASVHYRMEPFKTIVLMSDFSLPVKKHNQYATAYERSEVQVEWKFILNPEQQNIF